MGGKSTGGYGMRNDAQVRRHFMPLISNALEYVMEQIDWVNDDMLQTYLYDRYEPTTYERTEEFEKAWGYQPANPRATSNDKAKSAINGDHVAMEYGYVNWDEMEIVEVAPGMMAHSSPPGLVKQDVRPYLAQIIYQGLSGELYGVGPWTRSRAVWSHLVRTVGISKIKRWFEEGLKQQGVQGKWHR